MLLQYYTLVLPTLCTTSLHRPGTDHVRAAAAAGGRPRFQSLWPSHSKEWPLK